MPNSSGIYIDHHIAELEGVDPQLLNNPDELLMAAKNMAEDLKLTIVNTFIHKFEPHGLSLILVISQSHIAIHTWPEFGFMHVDIMTCSPEAGLDKLEKVLQKHFSPAKTHAEKIKY